MSTRQQSNPRDGNRKLIAVTMGDPAGVGPEIVAKAHAAIAADADYRMVVIGDQDALERAVKACDLDLTVVPVSSATTTVSANQIACLQTGSSTRSVPVGVVSAAGGQAAYEYIVRAAELAARGDVDAICTAPLNKEALHKAGHLFAGHTELLAELAGVDEVSMMLSAVGLRVIHVTTHVGLVDAIRLIEPGLVERTIRRGNDALVRSGIDRPRIAVCAINPHAGENGLFGYGEEAEKITPAVRACQDSGIDCVGPLPADTAFFRSIRGDFDLVVAMYHDQGHGPVKAVGLDDGVNITVGLPVIRTSVDHGTAFDIAGTGVASERSFMTALETARDMARVR